MKKFILKQNYKNRDSGWWIADINGDPGRTLIVENAKKYTSRKGSSIARAYYKKRYSHIRTIDLDIVEIEVKEWKLK